MKTETELLNIILSSEKKQSLCRICLSDEIDDQKSPLFEQGSTIKISLIEKISLCTRVEMVEDDFYPKVMCESCLRELNIANDFRIKCEKSQAVLKKIFTDFLAKNDTNFVNLQLEKLMDISDIKTENTDTTFDDQIDNLMDYSDDEEKTKIGRKVKTKERSKSNKNKKINAHSKFKQTDSESDVIKCEVDVNMKDIDDFKCSQCHKSFSNVFSLTKHTNRMHTKKEYVGFVIGHGVDRRFCCTECQYQSKRRQTLEYHMSRHTGLKQFRCDECGRGFGQHSSLAVHKKTHSDKTYFTCDHCGKEFKHRHIFVRHLLVHTNQRKYKCEMCGKELKSKSTLDDHINRHKQIKNYSCHVCALRFVALPDLTNHLHCHNKSTKIFKCEICPYSTYTKRMLAAHVFRHTASKDFSCDQCNAAFQTIHKLEIHKRSHTKENKYPCPLCESKFRYSYSVNKHMARVHNKKFVWNATVDRRTVK